MPYKIVVKYETGDSSGYYDVEDEIYQGGIGETTFPWHNLDICKENLEEIKRHYIQYLSMVELGKGRDLTEKDFKKLREYHSSFKPYLVNLLNDDMTTFQVTAPWIGCLETLYGASIVPVQEDGWSFEV